MDYRRYSRGSALAVESCQDTLLFLLLRTSKEGFDGFLINMSDVVLDGLY